jgi:hypothetical protein
MTNQPRQVPSFLSTLILQWFVLLVADRSSSLLIDQVKVLFHM